MRRSWPRSLVLGVLLLLTGCGAPQSALLATRAAQTLVVPTPHATPIPAVRDAADAIRIARTVVSPYMATWEDVIATEADGIWRVVFRELIPPQPNGEPSDDYYRIPLSVYIDANTGLVLRQEYR